MGLASKVQEWAQRGTSISWPSLPNTTQQDASVFRAPFAIQDPRAPRAPFVVPVIFEVHGSYVIVATLDMATATAFRHETSPLDEDRIATNLNLEEALEKLVADSVEEQFEVGMDSGLSRGLDGLCGNNPSAVLRLLCRRLPGMIHEVAAEVMRWTARQELKSSSCRLAVDLLELGLLHEAPLLRDTAALGLADLLEEGAVGLLRKALDREQVPELRQDIGDLIASLETSDS